MQKLRGKLGERGIEKSDALFSQAHDELESAVKANLHAQETGDPLDELSAILNHQDIQDWINKAADEPYGERTIGRPDLALGASDEPALRGVDEARKYDFTPENQAKWQKDGEAMLAKDYEGTVRMLAARGLAGRTLEPEETKAAQMIVAREMSLPQTQERSRRVASVIWAYRETGTAAGREMAARVDPLKSPVDRHREFLAKMIFMPPLDVRREIEKAKTPEEKQRLLDKDQERVATVKASLAKMGISFDDILNGEVKLSLKAAPALTNVVATLDSNRQKAFRLLQGGGLSFKEVTKQTGLSEVELNQVNADVIAQLRAKHFAKFEAGLDPEDIDTQGALFSQGEQRVVSHEEAEAKFQKMLRMMGIVPPEDQGKMKVVRRRTVKPKLFTPPAPKGPYEGPVPSGEPMEHEGRTEQDLLNPERNQVREPTGAVDNGSTEGRQGDLGVKTPYDGPTPGEAPVGTDGARQSNLGLPSGFDPDAWHEAMVRKGADLGDKDDAIRLGRNIQAANGNKFDMIREYWVQSILAGASSHFAYKLSTVGNIGFNMVIQRGMEAMLNMVYRDSDSAQLGEFKYIAKGFLPGLVDGFHLGVRQFRLETDLFRHEHETANEQTEIFKQGGTLPGDRPPAIPGETGRVVRMPTRVLRFLDGLDKGWGGRMEAGAQAYRIAKKEGLQGEELSSRINELIATKYSPAWQRAVERLEDWTFQKPVLSGKDGGHFGDAVVDWFSKGRDIRFGRNGPQLLGFLFPFVKLPYNIFKTGVRKSPIGSVNTLWQLGNAVHYKIRDGKPVFESYSAAQQTHDLAEQVIAWSVAALLWRAVPGDDDDDKKGLLLTTSQPRSEVKGGARDLNQRAYGGPNEARVGGRRGFSANYSKFEPAATVLTTTVDTMAQVKKALRLAPGTPLGDRAAMMADGVWHYFLAQAQEKTFMKGFDSVSRVLDGSSAVGKEAEKILLDGLVPNLIRQPLRNWDDFLRDSKHSGAGYEVLPSSENAEQRIDAWGRPVEKDGNKLSRMFFPSGAKPYPELEKADQLMLSWNRQKPLETWAPQPPTDTYHTPDGKTAKMTPEQYKRYSVLAGQTARDLLRGRISDSQIRKPTDEDVKMIKEAFTQAHEQAKAQILPGLVAGISRARR
jgi:hypothetical protein